MKIYYLAWGSLLWDNALLELDAPWRQTRLQLPLNFSRISDNGKGRVTLVIDNENGVLNPVYIAPTKINNLNEAINALKTREKTIPNLIGYVNLKNNSHRSNLLNENQINAIKKLAQKENADAIVWTDIPPNFPKVFGKNFSTEIAYKYILSQKNNTKLYNKILEYIFLSTIYGKIKTPLSKQVMENIISKINS